MISNLPNSKILLKLFNSCSGHWSRNQNFHLVDKSPFVRVGRICDLIHFTGTFKTKTEPKTDALNYFLHLETILILFGMTTLGSVQKDVILPFSALSVAKEPKFEPISYRKLYFWWLIITMKYFLSHWKLCFQFEFRIFKNAFPSIFLIFNFDPLGILYPEKGIHCKKPYIHLNELSTTI